MYSRSEIRFKTVSDFREAPITDLSSEIEAEMQGMTHDPWRGLKPSGLGESFQEVSRCLRDHSGQYWFGVSPCVQTGLLGMKSHSQSLQKTLWAKINEVFSIAVNL